MVGLHAVPDAHGDVGPDERGQPPGSVLVSEVFSAIQGEGALVGHRQVFLRLTGCPLRCAYCDQPEALEKRPGPCVVEQTPGARDFVTVDSPLTTGRTVDAVDRLWQALPHHSVSVTGGEPLMQSGRLVALLPQLRARGHRIFLETSGTLVEGYRRVAPFVDHVSMDVKLDSVDGQGVPIETHARFLEAVAASDAAAYAKVVLGPSTDPDELVGAVRALAAVAPGIEVFLQPVSPAGTVADAPTPEQVLAWQALALRVHPGRVRVVPQTHKAIGQR